MCRSEEPDHLPFASRFLSCPLLIVWPTTLYVLSGCFCSSAACALSFSISSWFYFTYASRSAITSSSFMRWRFARICFLSLLAGSNFFNLSVRWDLRSFRWGLGYYLRILSSKDLSSRRICLRSSELESSKASRAGSSYSFIKTSALPVLKYSWRSCFLRPDLALG